VSGDAVVAAGDDGQISGGRMTALSSIEIRPDSLAIVGWEEGSAGQVHGWLEASNLAHVACFVHAADSPPSIDPVAALKGRLARRFSVPTDTNFKDRPLVSSRDWPAVLRDHGVSRVLITLSDPKRREHEIETARRGGLELVNAIHPTALVMPEAVLGDSIILHAKSYVGYRAEIGDGVILNVAAQVDHHSVLRSCATLDPAVVLAGGVLVGARARIHTGATIINRITVGEDAIIGAGTVVIRDVERGAKVVGNPARRIG
jgi:sugar O-acyltransferase (sialic acid O-acetyltransferase NeuD family)